MRFTYMIVFIVINSLIIIEDYPINLILIAVFFYILLDYAIRAFFEYKYLENPKQYILTISEGVLFLLTIVIVIKFYLLDLLIRLS